MTKPPGLDLKDYYMEVNRNRKGIDLLISINPAVTMPGIGLNPWGLGTLG